MAIGLVSAIAFRLVTIIYAIKPALVRPIWYIGVIGYILFFSYRFYISEKRKKAVRDNHLLEKIQRGAKLDPDDREIVAYVLSSIIKSKEHINYLFIFLLSILAIGADIILAWHH
ncbi:MAG: hypothetical protein P8130_01885 [Deltaproteobacteria bacterium]